MAAVHGVTGLTEDEILWDLPLSKGFAYLHAALARDGVDMKWPGDESDMELARVRDFIRKKAWRN